MVSRRLPHGSIVSGKYRLLERLGGGGMGDVYRAEHTLAGRIVALKLLREDFADDVDVTRRFFQEAQAVNKVRHPNIVDVLDAGFSDQGPYVVMEILEGASVAAALERLGHFSLEGALAVVLPVLDALDAAHRHGVVHRDLKPENIFLARKGDEDAGVEVKLLDFGIAKVMEAPDDAEEARPRTHTGIIFGTPDYLSPEQASGDRVVDGRSDVFAVGTVLFELLTGRRPFQAKSAVATAYKVVHEAAPRLVDHGLRFDPLVQAVLDVALAKQPEDRFVNTAAFADMLAPLVPDGATRRAALVTLLDAAFVPVRDADHSGVPPARQKSEVPTAIASSSMPPSSISAPPPAGPPASPTLASGIAVALSPASVRPPPLTPRPPPPPLHVPDVAPSSTLSPRIAPPPAAVPTYPPLQHATPRAPLASTSRSWVPRPLPPRARGCHVRGTLARAVSRWIDVAYGSSAREEVLRLLPSEHAEYFHSDAFNALVWYELDPVDMFLEASTAVLLHGEAFHWRALAREHAHHDLMPLFRSGRGSFDPLVVLRRSPSAWRKIFDFGEVRVDETKTPAGARVVVHADGFDATSLALRYAMVGTMEALVLGCGLAAPPLVRITAGESAFAPDFAVEIAWLS